MKNLKLILMMMLLIVPCAIFFSGCSLLEDKPKDQIETPDDNDNDNDNNGGDNTNTFTFNITSNIPSACTISYVNKASYSYGEEISVLITVNDGYYLKGYSDSDIKENYRYITITQNTNITVYFAQGNSIKLGNYYIALLNGENITKSSNDTYVNIAKQNTNRFGYYKIHNTKTNKDIIRCTDKIYASYLDTWFGTDYTNEWLEISQHNTSIGDYYAIYVYQAGINAYYDAILNPNYALKENDATKMGSNFLSSFPNKHSLISVLDNNGQVTFDGIDYDSTNDSHSVTLPRVNNRSYIIFRLSIFTIDNESYYYIYDVPLVSPNFDEQIVSSLGYDITIKLAD